MSTGQGEIGRGVSTRSRAKAPRRLAKNALKALLLVTLLFAPLAHAQSSELANADPKVEARLKHLAEELRCLVCQNQTIADSNAPLAVDLRNQIRTQIGQGRDDDQIRDYMVQRYGDFVLYRPPRPVRTTPGALCAPASASSRPSQR